MKSLEKIKKVFFEALEKETDEEREAYLNETCQNDPSLRIEIDALLKGHFRTDSFLKGPILDSQVSLDNTSLLEMPGTVIGRYKLLEKIGEGGMAVVYMAEQQEPILRKVALKIIKLGMDTKQVIARFEAERQALAMMDHPNIAKVLDAGATETGRPYFVMELVTGVSITEYCDENKLSTKDRQTLFIKVCNAVQHAHQKGIIHRDIKPSNVMVTQRDGTPIPKIIDFGIAKAINQRLTEKTLFTRYAHIIGTPAYMSPEQAELSDLGIDTRTDIYSLGVLLYELLTGTPPFSEEELRKAGYLEMQRIIREEEPTKPSTKLSTLGKTLTDVAKSRQSTPDLLRKAVRGDLDWIVMKSLEKERIRRYETVYEMSTDILHHLRHEPISARPPVLAYVLSKYLRKHKLKIATIVTITILLTSVIIISLMWNQNRVRLMRSAFLADKAILSQAREAFAKNDLVAALKDAESIINSKHVGSEAKLLYAGIMVEGSRPEEAVSTLESLLTKEQEIAGAAHALLARVYWEGQFKEAEKLKKVDQHRQKAAELLPETAESYFLRALTTASIKEKLNFLNRALALDPSHYEALKLRAFTSYASKDYEATEDDARVQIALRPQDNAGYQLRGLALRGLGHHEEAVRSLTKAIKLKDAPDLELIELYSHRRRTYMLMGEYEKAIQDAHTSVSLSEGAWIHHFHLFCALVASGRHDLAEVRYQKELARDKSLFRRYCTDYVFDMLANDQELDLPEDAGSRAAFLPMVEAIACYRSLATKAKRVIDEGFRPTWSPNGMKLVYSMGVHGTSGVATYDFATGKTQLLVVPGKDPYYSPDGQHIAFIRDRSVLPIADLSVSDLSHTTPVKASEEIWIMKADGTSPRRLARGYEPSWSWDSGRIYFTSGLFMNRYSISISEPVAEPKLEIAGLGAPARESSDRRYTAFVNAFGVYVADPSSGKILYKWLPPPPTGWLLSEGISWLPDGSRFCVGGLGEHNHGLWLYDVSTNDALRLFEGPIISSSWSLEGRLAFCLSRPINDIWVADLKDIGPGCSVDQHCREMMELYSHRAYVDPNDWEHRFWINAFKQYSEIPEEDWFDWYEYIASHWANPTCYGVATPFWGAINSSFSDGDFCVSSDGLQLYFGSNRQGGHGSWDIWVTTRRTVNDQWEPPLNLGVPVNGSYEESAPCITPDGLSLFFGSNRPGGQGGYDIWVTTRAAQDCPWGPPLNLGAPINSPGEECLVSVSVDGLELYFSELENALPGGYGLCDIWVTTRSSLSDPWEPPVNLGPTINSPYHDKNPFISADGLLLMFSSTRPGGYAEDIWVARRTSVTKDFGSPIPLSPPVNNVGCDGCPFLSLDGSLLYFLSDRGGDYRIWQVPILRTKRELPMDFTGQKAMEEAD